MCVNPGKRRGLWCTRKTFDHLDFEVGEGFNNLNSEIRKRFYYLPFPTFIGKAFYQLDFEVGKTAHHLNFDVSK